MVNSPIIRPSASLPFVLSDVLAKLATDRHAPAFLARGGGVQRAQKLVERGRDVQSAARTAAQQAKGHIAELQLSTEFTACAGTLLRPLTARPNLRANDPIVDIEVLCSRVNGNGILVAGHQVKNGSQAYVRKALSRTSRRVVTSVGTRRQLEAAQVDVSRVDVNVEWNGVASQDLSLEATMATAQESLIRVLESSPAVPPVKVAAKVLGIGCFDGFVAFAGELLFEVVDAFMAGRPFDPEAIERAALRGVRAGARGSIEAGLLVRRYLDEAKAVFRERLLHRLAGSALVYSAIAEVVVEVGIDLVAVLRGQRKFEELLPRAVVHVSTAAGSAIAVGLALRVLPRAPWWIVLPAVVFAGVAGGFAGRGLGNLLVGPIEEEPAEVTA